MNVPQELQAALGIAAELQQPVQQLAAGQAAALPLALPVKRRSHKGVLLLAPSTACLAFARGLGTRGCIGRTGRTGRTGRAGLTAFLLLLLLLLLLPLLLPLFFAGFLISACAQQFLASHCFWVQP